MSELERLEFENKELRAECEFLRKMLTDERRFFLETLKHDSLVDELEGSEIDDSKTIHFD